MTTKFTAKSRPALPQQDKKPRVTSARLFMRSRQKQFAVVPEQKDSLLEKEKICCVAATD